MSTTKPNEIDGKDTGTRWQNVRRKVHGALLLASLPMIAYYGLFATVTAPERYGLVMGQGACIIVLCCGTGLGAVTLWLVTRAQDGHFRRGWTTLCMLLQGLAAACYAMGLALPETALVAQGSMLFSAIFAAPAVMALWARVFAQYSSCEVLVNTVCAFALFVCLAMPMMDAPAILLPGVSIALALSGIAGFAAQHRASSHTNAAEDRSDEKNDVERQPTAKEEKSSAMQRCRHLFSSIAALGCGLYVFSWGAASCNDGLLAQFFPTGSAACLIAVAALAYYLSHRGSATEHQLRYRLFDLALPMAAIVAFAIKMIPIDAVSLTLFREYMEVYFLVLGVAFWANFVLFVRANPSLQAIASSLFNTAVVALLVVGFAVGWIEGDYDTVVLGLVTAAFIILAIVRAGHNLTLYLKGPETAEELAQPMLNMAEVCAKASDEYRLTPREAEVLGELAFGHSSTYIAQVLFISNNTARSHMKNIYKKLGVGSREEVIELLRNWQ